MKVFRDIDALRAELKAVRSNGKTVGFVPTMGFFHEGHLSLMRHAQDRCDYVVVSLFVNPKQFGPGEDLQSYPSDEEHDLEQAEEAGVDAIFIPKPDEIYPTGFSTRVTVHGLTDTLCGRFRSGDHFTGVTTVVCKLLNTVQPDVACFGQKDAQQAVTIQRMVEDLNMPVEIVICPTVRERDGLAMSSRNAYLGAEQRTRASAISRGLFAAEELLKDGTTDRESLLAAVHRELNQEDLEPEYVELVSLDSLQPVEKVTDRALLAIAVPIGRARLIDNTILDLQGEINNATHSSEIKDP